jgi:acetyl-CoA carboxylase carboxyl transferase subunit alpha
MKLRVPILVIILSEGGSGGALAIGVGDYICMFENAIYSILSPEGFASILFKDSQQAEKAAAMMKLTAKDLLAFNVIDQIILEKEGLHENPSYGIDQLKNHLSKNLTKLMKQNKENLLKNRYDKFRSIGIYSEEGEHNDTSEDQGNI